VGEFSGAAYELLDLDLGLEIVKMIVQGICDNSAELSNLLTSRAVDDRDGGHKVDVIPVASRGGLEISSGKVIETIDAVLHGHGKDLRMLDEPGLYLRW
jgi:hypothetical protein